MCECFGRANVEIEDLPPRYYGGPPRKRVSLVKDIRRDYDDAYSRPRPSNTSMKQVAYRPAKSSKQKEDEDKDKSQYKSPQKMDKPKESRFIPLPPLIHDDETEEIRQPKKGILRGGKKKYGSPSLVVYSPKRGRGDRKYYYEDDDSDSWDGRSGRTDWSEASGDSWAMRPVKKYSEVKRKDRSRSRGRGRYH